MIRHSPPKYSVLIIDDSPADLLWAQRTLDRKEYVTFTAADGEAGLELAREKKPDVIVLDCILPGLSGIEVCKTLKREEGTQHIPVVFLTVVEDGLNLLKCYEAGADCYLIKPIKARQLTAAVWEAIKNRNI